MHSPHPRRPGLRLRIWLAVVAVIAAAGAIAAQTNASASPSRPAQAAAPAAAATARTLVNRPVGVLTPVQTCAQLASLDLTGLPGAPTQIDSATTATAAAGWGYCNVTGTIAPQDQFDLQLPLTTYTQRYLQTGCGGLCGTLSISAPASFNCLPVNNGAFAEASDDEGHTSGGGTFGANPELRADFGYITEHELAVVAKTLIKDFYGSAPSYSYYDGCSQGGHEALLEAQRYPQDFNGIIAGAPAMITQELNTFYQPWLANVDWTPSGQPILTADQLPLLHNAVLAACDGNDGLVDGQIDDPRNCDFNPATLQCAGAAAPTCLTAAQVAVVKKIYSGPVDPQGQRLYPGGEPFGSELAWAGWMIPEPGQTFASTIAASIGGQWLKWLAFDGVLPGSQTADLQHAVFTQAEFDKVRRLAGLYDADDPNLAAFRAAGGKLIIWQGWADQAISPFGTIDYYTAMTKAMGGLAATQRFARLFMLPGVNHCGGGQAPNQIDMVDPMLDWVEHGVAPASVVATETSTTSPATVVRTRPVYPYPEVARYNGTGSINVAANFHGVIPTTAQRTTAWLGTFPSAPLLWCSYRGTDYVCETRRQPV
jgi:Tannase and feruloyl esterase